jgi:DNA (cytosine-5)-methyltransferase 1
MTKPQLTAFSLFSGIGGLCEGVRLAGFRVTGASEWDKYAAESYRHNYPGTPLFDGDVADLFPDDKTQRRKHIDQFVGSDSVDLVFGGPPCQGYSQIGPRDIADPRNEMYLQLCRVATLLKPKFILMENVPNMLLMRGGMFRERITRAFRDAGYDNQAVAVLDASLYGVPQKRKRVFILAARGSVFRFPLQDALEQTAHSLEQDPITVDEAISDLPEDVADDSGVMLPYPKRDRLTRFQREMRLDCNGEHYSSAEKLAHGGGHSKPLQLHNHHTKEIQAERLALIKLLAPGKKADSLPREVWDNARPEKWRRFDPDAPAHTLMAQMHRDLSEWVHPHYHRWITVREALRLQAFHDGFVLKTSEWQQLKQVGNAVPPLLGRVPAMALRFVLSAQRGEPPPFAIRGQLSLLAATA